MFWSFLLRNNTLGLIVDNENIYVHSLDHDTRENEKPGIKVYSYLLKYNSKKEHLENQNLLQSRTVSFMQR